MIRSLSLVVALIAAGPASALSCLQPSVASTYGAADRSASDYVIAIGSLTAAGPSDPPDGSQAVGGDINRMVGYTQPAVFSGRFFTGTGFGQSRSVPVIADVTCVAAWCGSYADQAEALIFLRRDTDASYTLEIGACPQFVFPRPTQAQRQAVIACHQSGGC